MKTEEFAHLTECIRSLKIFRNALCGIAIALWFAQAVNAQIPSQGKIHYEDSRPWTRWWWFSTEIKEDDVLYQLEWLKENGFGGVEIAWVYPQYRYNKSLPVDSSGQKWLSREWMDIVAYAKHCADSLGLGCDFTFGSAWPVGASYVPRKYSTKVFGDTAFKQQVTFAWEFPVYGNVIDHLNKDAFDCFARPLNLALGPCINEKPSAFFTDSWEIKLNWVLKIWTDDFDQTFQKEYGYSLFPVMDCIDLFPEERYDYMKHLSGRIIDGFYKPFYKNAKSMGAVSRVQALASPTQVMEAYRWCDVPESEAMLNDPSFSRIVSSAAALHGQKTVSAEAFTCMYGFPGTFLRREQAADLKLVADALISQGINQFFYHGMPFQKEKDSVNFFATVYVGPDGNLSEDFPGFNEYLRKVCSFMKRGSTSSKVAVYLPWEDAIMAGAYPRKQQRVWVWGQYELRTVNPPEQLKGYNPAWISEPDLGRAEFRNGKLRCGDASFEALYAEVKYMDASSLRSLLKLAKQGLPVCLVNIPQEPGKNKSADYAKLVSRLRNLPNVKSEWKSMPALKPIVEGNNIPDFWCRESNGETILFFAHPFAAGLSYPVYAGQSFTNDTLHRDIVIHVNGFRIPVRLSFLPYQSLLLRITEKGEMIFEDIVYQPPVPEVRPRTKQRSFF